MPATTRTAGAVDPDLYERLLEERYGPLREVFAERHRPSPAWPAPPKAAPGPDPHAARHLAELQAEIARRRP